MESIKFSLIKSLEKNRAGLQNSLLFGGAMITGNLSEKSHSSRVLIEISTPEGKQTNLLSDSLVAAELSYSHSDGRVEDKAAFIAGATNGKSKWVSLVYKDPTIRVVGPTAIVRFNWLGEAESIPEGKKSSTNLHILMTWQKQGSDWKLLSRGSTKLG